MGWLCYIRLENDVCWGGEVLRLHQRVLMLLLHDHVVLNWMSLCIQNVLILLVLR